MPPRTFKYSHVFIWILPDLRLTKLPFVVFKEAGFAAASSPVWCRSGWDGIRLVFLCFSGCFFAWTQIQQCKRRSAASVKPPSHRWVASPCSAPPNLPATRYYSFRFGRLKLRPWPCGGLWCLCKRKELSDLFIFFLVKVQKSAQTSCLDKWHADTTMVCTYQVTLCIYLNFVSFFQFTCLSVKSIKCFVFLFLVLHFTKINHFDLVILINSG